MQDGGGGEHEAAGAEVGAGEDDEAEAVGEDQGGDGAD